MREVRIVREDDPDALIKTQMAWSLESARTLAAEWKTTVMATGSFTEAPNGASKT